MALWKDLLKFGALAAGLFVLVGVAIPVLWTALWGAVGVIATAIFIFLFAGVAYGAVRGALWLYAYSKEESDSRNGQSSADATSVDGPVDRLTKRYVDGEISEAELERQLERELDDSEPDEIDRELERARS